MFDTTSVCERLFQILIVPIGNTFFLIILFILGKSAWIAYRYAVKVKFVTTLQVREGDWNDRPG